MRRVADGQVDVALESGTLEAYVNHAAHQRWRFAAAAYSVEVTGTVLTVTWESGELDVAVETGAVLVTGPGLGDGRVVRGGERFSTREEEEEGASPPHDDAAPAKLAPPRPAKRGPPPRAPDAPQWQTLARQGRYAEALNEARTEGLPAILARGSAAELALLADTARYARAAKEARHALETLNERFPKSRQARLVPYLQGRIAADVDADPREAARLFALYVSREPRGVLVEEARARCMEAWQHAGDTSRASAAARDYLEHHPGGAYAELARSLAR